MQPDVQLNSRGDVKQTLSLSQSNPPISILLLAIFALLTLVQPISAVEIGPGFLWLKQAADTNQSAVTDMALDHSDGVYAAGNFRKTLAIDSVTLNGSHHGSNSSTAPDLFVSRFTSAGKLLWAHAIAGDVRPFGSLAIMPQGGVIVAGAFQNTLAFEGSAKRLDSTSTDSEWSIFVANYDASGRLLWARTVARITESDPDLKSGPRIRTDPQGNFFLTGQGSGQSTIDFGTTNIFFSYSGKQLYLAKFDTTGNFKWIVTAPFYQPGIASSLFSATDRQGNVLLAGTFEGELNLGGTALSSKALLYPPDTYASWYPFDYPSTDIFLAKFNSAGRLLWIKQAGGAGNDALADVGFDNQGNLYTAGSFEREISFDQLSLTNSFPPLAPDYTDRSVFLTKYDSQGNPLWARQRLALPQADAYGLAVDRAGNPYLAGQFGRLSESEGRIVEDFIYGLMDFPDLFVAKYDTAGNPIWVHHDNGTLPYNYFSIVVNSTGNVLIGGNVTDFHRTIIGHHDTAFLGKLAVKNSESPPWILQQPAPPQLIPEGESVTLSTIASGAQPLHYQWLYQNRSIPGATKSSFTMGDVQQRNAGDYRVLVFNSKGWLFSSNASLSVTPHKVLPAPAWTRQGKSPDNDSIGIAVDTGGNTCIVGNFENFERIGTNTLYSHGSRDVFIARYDRAGNVLWVRTIGGDGEDDASAITSDKNGSIYISGSVGWNTTSPTMFANGQTLPAGDFLAKYDSAGNLIWVLPTGASSMVTDPWGNLYTVKSSYALTEDGQSWVFTGGALSKHDPSGVLIWSNALDWAEFQSSSSVAVDSAGNPFITAIARGSTNLSNSNLDTTGPFLAKFDPAGNMLWMQGIQGSFFISPSIAVDGSGSVYVEGVFTNSLCFNSKQLITSNGYGLALAKYSNNGQFLWAHHQADSKQFLYAQGIAVDNKGCVHIGGTFLGPVQFGTTVLKVPASPLLSVTYNRDSFWAKYDPMGNLLGVRQLACNASSISGLAVNANQEVFVTGWFYTAESIALGKDILSSFGSPDFFLMKFASP